MLAPEARLQLKSVATAARQTCVLGVDMMSVAPLATKRLRRGTTSGWICIASAQGYAPQASVRILDCAHCGNVDWCRFVLVLTTRIELYVKQAVTVNMTYPRFNFTSNCQA
jgi:hypothetical protein